MTAHKDDTKDSKWIGDLFRKALRPSEYQWKHKSKIPLGSSTILSCPGSLPIRLFHMQMQNILKT